MSKLKIVSDGTPQNTKLFVDEPDKSTEIIIPNLTSIKWEISCKKSAKISLEFSDDVEVELIGKLEGK